MMKKIIFVTSILISGLLSANAQKGKVQTGVASNTNKTISRALPDLTFSLSPVLVGGNNGVEKVEGQPGRIKTSINYIVKNIGMVTSKPTTVYAEYSFKGTQRVGNDSRESTIHVTSEPINLPPIEMNKDILQKQVFTFKTTPEQAYGKPLKMRLVIMVTGTNNQNEVSVSNNISDEILLSINR